MKLVIRQEAVDDLDGIYDWIAKDNLSAAIRVVRVLRQAMDSEATLNIRCAMTRV